MVKMRIVSDKSEDIKKEKFDIVCKKCGWRNRLIYSDKIFHNKKVCRRCGNYVFINDLEEFKFRIKEKRIRNGI